MRRQAGLGMATALGLMLLAACASDEEYFAAGRTDPVSTDGTVSSAQPVELDEDVPEVASVDAGPGPEQLCSDFVVAHHGGAQGKKAPEVIAEARAAGVDASRLVPIGTPAKDALSVPGRLSIMVYGTDEVVGVYCG